MLFYVHSVKQLNYTLRTMDLVFDEREIERAVFNTLPPRYEDMIVSSGALDNEDKLFSLDYIKTAYYRKNSVLRFRVIMIDQIKLTMPLPLSVEMKSFVMVSLMAPGGRKSPKVQMLQLWA